MPNLTLQVETRELPAQGGWLRHEATGIVTIRSTIATLAELPARVAEIDAHWRQHRMQDFLLCGLSAAPDASGAMVLTVSIGPVERVAG